MSPELHSITQGIDNSARHVRISSTAMLYETSSAVEPTTQNIQLHLRRVPKTCLLLHGCSDRPSTHLRWSTRSRGAVLEPAFDERPPPAPTQYKPASRRNLPLGYLPIAA